MSFAAGLPAAAFAGFAFLLALYVAYNVHALRTAAAARSAASSPAAPSEAVPVPEPEERAVGQRHNAVAAARAAASAPSSSRGPPPVRSFGAWKRQDGSGLGRRAGPGGGRPPVLVRPGKPPPPTLAAWGGAGKLQGSAHHVPASTGAAGGGLGEAGVASGSLLAELDAHMARACREGRLAAGSVPERACQQLAIAAAELRVAGRAKLQQRAHALIELVRQSIGPSSSSGELATAAAALMKDLSVLSHAGAGPEVDDMLDAHVGSHSFGEDGGGNSSLHAGNSARAGSVQQLVQGALLARQQEQAEALRAHQHIPVGAVGRNAALLGGPPP
eukprot:jgi/Tetstr1/444833/TSEL_032675.t1